jgi:membrane complex biogenesis BtpA family protein
MPPLTTQQFHSRFGARPLFGMVHLLPLPGSPRFETMAGVLERALADAAAIEKGGASGIVVENFGDVPFFKKVGAATVSAMTRVIAEIRRATHLPIGVNVLRNDGESALAIAAATGAEFVRINVLVGAMVTDQGIIEGEAASILRRRRELAPEVLIFADHMVKHAAPLAAYDERQLAKDLRLRAAADAVIVSGSETGGVADPERLKMLRETIDAPLLVGSGLTEENASQFAGLADGAIVGTSILSDGRLGQPVDASRLAALAQRFR